MSTMGSTGSPLNDPAVARRAHRMMLAVLAVIGVLLVVRSFIGTTVGTGEAAAHASPVVSFQLVQETSGFWPGATGFHLVTSTATPSLPVSVTRSLTNPCSARST